MLGKLKAWTSAVALLVGVLTSLPTAQSQAQNINASCRVTTESTRSYKRLPYASIKYNKQFARIYMQNTYGWCGSQYVCLHTLWNHESGWRVNAHNSSSGAHGIPQALPGSKMGTGWRTNPNVQIIWGLKYIKSRYNTPCNALSVWNRQRWY